MADLRPYTPTWRDTVASWMMGQGQSSPERRAFVGGLLGSTGLGNTGVGVVDATPVGGLLGLQEASQAGDKAGMALAATGLLPGAGMAGKITEDAAPSLMLYGSKLLDNIKTKEQYAAHSSAVDKALSDIQNKYSDLLRYWENKNPRITTGDISSIFEKHNVPYKLENSQSLTDSYGPSRSSYFHFNSANGDPTTFRLSDHDYMPTDYDYRFNTHPERIESALLNLIGKQPVDDEVNLYRDYISALRETAPYMDEKWHLGNLRPESLPSENSKRYQKRMSKVER